MEFTPESRLRAERLLLFCWQERIIDRACLTRCLTALSKSDSDASLGELKALLSNATLADTHRRLATYADSAQQLLSDLHSAKPVEKLSLPPQAAIATPALPEIGESAMVPEPPPEVTAGGSADLQVSMLPRLMGPITAVLLVVLGFFVFGAFQSVSDYFTAQKSDSDPQNLNATSNPATGSNGQPTITPDETTLEVVPTPQTGVSTKLDLRDALDRLIPSEQWQEAIDVLNSPRYRQRDEKSILWEATVLTGSKRQQNIDDALRLLCAPSNIRSEDPTWRQLYALLLLQSTATARDLAIESIRNSSGRAMQLPRTLRILDWASARSGGSEADLAALRKRLADFTADSLDHFFLAYANFSDKRKDQASYHISKARQRYLPDYVPDEEHPQWLHEFCDKQLSESIDKLRDKIAE